MVRLMRRQRYVGIFPFAVIVLTALFIADLGRAYSSEKLEPASGQPPLIVNLGGFATCTFRNISKTPLYKKVRNAVHEVFTATGRRPNYFASCFDARRQIFYVDSRKSHVTKARSMQEVFNRIEELSKFGALPVYLVGHSYGGWLALRTVIQMPKSVVFSALYTLDPISYVDCPPRVFLASIPGYVFEPNQDKCRRAPSDLLPYYAGIRARVGTWTNYHQNHYQWLHSSAIAEAHENVHKAFGHVEPMRFLAHKTMNEDSKIWSRIVADVIADLAPQAKNPTP